MIIEAIKEKKGERIVSIDLKKINDAACDFFVVCEATSGSQVKAIADYVIKSMEESEDEKPWHFEGMKNQDWILLDYFNVVVHIFKDEQRRFYAIEELWSDGITQEHND